MTIKDELSLSSMDFENKREGFYRNIANNHIWFDVEKMCGYSEFITIHHLSTTRDVWNHIRKQFENPNIRLFFLDISSNSRIDFPQSDDILLQSFIRENNHIFVPIYPYPAKVVYKIYLDDGCHDSLHNHACHTHSNNNNDEMETENDNEYYHQIHG
jgi:hypothetical protein